MPDIYGKNVQYKNTGLVTADEMILTIQGGGTTTAGQTSNQFLVQSVIIQYNQPVNRVFEIGSSFVYFAPGRPIGNLQIGRIVGSKLITALLGQTGTGVWTAAAAEAAGDKTVTFRKGSAAGGSISGGNDADVQLHITGLIIESYGFQTDANGTLCQENISGQFASLTFGGDVSGIVSAAAAAVTTAGQAVTEAITSIFG